MKSVLFFLFYFLLLYYAGSFLVVLLSASAQSETQVRNFGFWLISGLGKISEKRSSIILLGIVLGKIWNQREDTPQSLCKTSKVLTTQSMIICSVGCGSQIHEMTTAI